MKRLKKQFREVIFRFMSEIDQNFNFYIENAYEQAQKLWQLVSWPRENFVAHLAGRTVAHPCDLYLAGAAGNRLDSAWTQIDTSFRQRAISKFSTKARADMTGEELWAETIFKLYDQAEELPVLETGKYPAKIIRYDGKAKLFSYIVTAAMRIAIDRKRKKKPDSMPTDENGNSLPQQSPTKKPQELAQDRELAESFAKNIARGLERLEAEERFLLVAVFRDKIKQRQLAKFFKLKDYAITRKISAAVKKLQESIESVSGVEWNTQTLNAWQQAWDDFCTKSENCDFSQEKEQN